jgi:hypothetical protein
MSFEHFSAEDFFSFVENEHLIGLTGCHATFKHSN